MRAPQARCRRRREQSLPGLALAVAGLSVLVCVLSGCTRVGVVTGAAAVTGTAATSERGLGTTISDDRIWLEINRSWLAHDPTVFEAVKLQVHEGRVLLTGVVDRPEARMDAVRIAWGVDGVREVINEIVVSREGDSESFLRDRWIVSQLRSKLLFDREIRSINYSIETVAGVVYLMGIAQSEAELQRAIDHARDIAYVRRVVSYVQLKDDPARQASR